jgi:hypothetical protein
MATGITRKVVESYLKYKYKSYLRQIGEVGSRSSGGGRSKIRSAGGSPSAPFASARV